ncbi:hypothetical protein N9O61_00845 [Octadecabacter sp.]|nr:hypothetical protein [Octadecabacter sp.]
MNRTLALSAAIAAGATALAAAALGTQSVDVGDAPGMTEIKINAPHHDGSLEGVVWYPANADGRGKIIAENGVYYGVQGRIDATLANGEYPVVVLSHGMGGHYRTMAWLASELADQGAIVVAVNHPNSTWGDFDLAAGMNHWTRAQDITAALDWVTSDPMFEGHIDDSRTMAAGFSYGGWTALSLAGVQGSHQGYLDHCAEFPTESSHCNDLMSAQIQLADADPSLWNASYLDPRFTHITAVDPGLMWGLTDNDVPDVTADVRLIALGDGEDRLLATNFDQSGFADLLPNVQINRFAPANHFMFLPLCKPEGAAILEDENDDPVCTDPEGSDRAAVHDAVIDLIAADLGLQD